MKKRIISLLLAAVLAASLCACGEQQAADGASAVSSGQEPASNTSTATNRE